MTITATTERTRLEAWREQEAKLAERIEEKRTRIAIYPEKIREAREESFYSKPSKRPLAQLNSPLQKLIDAEKADVAALHGLEADLSAVRSVIAVEAARVAEEETAEAWAQLKQLHTREEELWTRGGELVGKLADAWNQYVDLAEEEDKLAQKNGLDGSGALAVVPAPLSFKSWLLLLHAAATDPAVRAEPYEEQLIDAGAFRTEHGNVVYDVKPAGTRQVEMRRKLDSGDRLHDLIPDLTAVVRALQLRGQIPTITE
jgi:hypothetical protein